MVTSPADLQLCWVGKVSAHGIAPAPAVGDAGTSGAEPTSRRAEVSAVGGFGFVVGVDRVGQTDAMRAHGADTAASDLA